MVIKRSLDALLSHSSPGEQGGFVIFHGPTDLDYVQYSVDEVGLLLNWPTVQEGGHARLPLFVEVLKSRGFVDHSARAPATVDREAIVALSPGQMCIADDGLYAQCGRDAQEVAELTASLLQFVFEVPDLLRVEVTLEADG